MPLYEALTAPAQEEKPAVVLDLGNAFTKLGFAGEFSPRFILPSEIPDKLGSQRLAQSLFPCDDVHELERKLKEFLRIVYFKYLLVNPKSRRVVIVESFLTPSDFKQALAEVLFNHFDVPSICFVPSHLVATFTLGINTALVVDVGYKETIVIPVFEGIPVLNLLDAVPLAGKAIHSQIERQLLGGAVLNANAHNPEITKPLSELMSSIPERVVEDIKVRTCFVTEFSRGQKLQQSSALPESQEDQALTVVPPPDVEYSLEDGQNILNIQGYIREGSAEVLWELDNEEKSVATLILDVIAKANRDMRVALSENILIIGGTASLVGFRHRLLAELNHIANTHPKYLQTIPKKVFKVHDPPAKPNYVSWLGGAIFGALDTLASRSIHRDSFNTHRFIPDWNSPHAENPYKESEDVTTTPITYRMKTPLFKREGSFGSPSNLRGGMTSSSPSSSPLKTEKTT